MKSNVFKIAAILLMLAGCFSSCKDDDIDMSKIDFSNIEDLYAQPLQVIQKAVQGKWKVYQTLSDGDTYDVQYPENAFVEFKNDNYIEDYNGHQNVFYFTWKKLPVENWRDPLYGYETYIMYGGDRINNWHFDRIKNDTLFMGAHKAPLWFEVIRVK